MSSAWLALLKAREAARGGHATLRVRRGVCMVRRRGACGARDACESGARGAAGAVKGDAAGWVVPGRMRRRA